MKQTVRSLEVDMIRLAALIGICMVNVPFMALPIDTIFYPAVGFSNQITAFTIESLFQFKFFILFSFIFGWGAAIQQQSALAKGKTFSHSYLRRLLGLIVLGALHAILVFSGDILLLYGLVGLLLWLVRDWTIKALLTLAICMIPLSMISLTGLVLLAETLITQASPEVATSLAGGYLEATMVRLTDWPTTLLLLIFLQGPIVFAAFATGFAAGKSQFFEINNQSFNKFANTLPWLILIALPLNLLYAMVMGGFIGDNNELLALFSMVSIAIGAPALAAVYLFALVKLARCISLPQLLRLAGQNSLSVYVLQGVLSGFVFGSYGLGYYNQFEPAQLSLISLSIAISTILAIGLFAMKFGKGPLEPILRHFSRGKDNTNLS
ncbi:MAG: DUF418 domain-containing protein [Psychromonas sp.]|nr:DUF418 domain-containing protein [Alteromonadales bacterium]MCP5079352.1 DUF418 domain-containing protein [Psychromonas sp.]